MNEQNEPNVLLGRKRYVTFNDTHNQEIIIDNSEKVDEDDLSVYMYRAGIYLCDNRYLLIGLVSIISIGYIYKKKFFY